MQGRPKAELVLTEPEREELVALTLRRKTAQALALRARIVRWPGQKGRGAVERHRRQNIGEPINNAAE